MSETTQHTPGPWHTAFEEGTKVKDAGKNTVAWLQATHLRGRRSAEEVAANARLISAAPDMLEALQQAVESGMVPTSSVKDGGATSHVRQVVVADMIRAAIAKATGEAS